MTIELTQRKVARVLFDEFHGEAWSIRPDAPRSTQPQHPQDSSHAAAAAALAERDFVVDANVDGPLTSDRLAGADVVVLAHPSDPKWERTVNENSPVLSA